MFGWENMTVISQSRWCNLSAREPVLIHKAEKGAGDGDAARFHTVWLAVFLEAFLSLTAHTISLRSRPSTNY